MITEARDAIQKGPLALSPLIQTPDHWMRNSRMSPGEWSKPWHLCMPTVPEATAPEDVNATYNKGGPRSEDSKPREVRGVQDDGTGYRQLMPVPLGRRRLQISGRLAAY